MGDNGKKGGAHTGRAQGRKMASITKSGPTRIGLTRFTAKDQPLPKPPKPGRRQRSGHGKHALGAVRPAEAAATVAGTVTAGAAGAAAMAGAGPAAGAAAGAAGGPAGDSGPGGRGGAGDSDGRGGAGGHGGRGGASGRGGSRGPGGAGGPAGGAGSTGPAGGAGGAGAAGAKGRKGRKARKAERAALIAAAEAAMSPSALARDKDRKLRHRRHVILVSGLVGLFVLIVGGISAAVYITNLPPSYYSPAHVSSDDAGIVVGGSGHVKVDLYLDYACPTCKTLESTTFATLHQMISRGQITLVYHPVALLDGQSKAHYSTRAASAAACASDQGSFLAFSSALFATPPRANGRGLSDDQLIQVAGAAGIIDPNYAQCVRGERYKTWVDHVTSHARAHGITAVPTVTVNGAAIAPAGVSPTLQTLVTAVGNAQHAAEK